MTAEKIVPVDMDVYRFIDYTDGYSRLVRRDSLEHQPDIAAMNLAGAANYRAAQARAAHPHYKRQGHIDAVTGAFTPYTDDELADMKAARRESRAIRALVGIILVCAGIAVIVLIGVREGWLS